MARVRLRTSAAVAVSCRALTRTRGVITFSAVRPPREMVRTKRSAVSCSRAPARAEWRASETSSVGVRAEASSSAGSTPSARTRRFAAALRASITGRNTAEKARCGPATKRATSSGRDTAQFFGTSSPMTIWTAEARIMPITTATAGAAPPGTPTEVRGPENRSARAGSASMPTTSEVIVMPSWVPDSWKDSLRSASTTLRALRSPSAAARSAAGRSTVTRPNSAATKKPFARIRRKAAASSSNGALMPPLPYVGGRGGAGTTGRSVHRGLGVTPRVVAKVPE